ncbi:hypothetical protein [Streptomyces hirsutus]|uniref:hypothetical protein n=1 Tax=Streptomyces hirsutus TaxID=35620 RepID=UPI000AAC4B6C
MVDYSADGWMEAAKTAVGGEFAVVLEGVGGERGTAAPSAAGTVHGPAAAALVKADPRVQQAGQHPPCLGVPARRHGEGRSHIDRPTALVDEPVRM